MLWPRSVAAHQPPIVIATAAPVKPDAALAAKVRSATIPRKRRTRAAPAHVLLETPAPAEPQQTAAPETAAPPESPPREELPLTPVNPGLTSFQPTAVPFAHGPATVPRVALTFDAGSDAKAVPLILKTLEERHVHATFFLTGRFCEKFPSECRAIADAGMELGNHSYSHPRFTRLSDAKILEELDRSEAAIVKACGRGAKPLFRFPFGDNNARTQRIVAGAGYQPIHWTLDSLDAFRQPKTADFVADRIDSRIQPGYITLMHVSCITSAQALPRIFEHLDKMGAQVAPVSELLLNAPQDAKTDTLDGQ